MRENITSRKPNQPIHKDLVRAILTSRDFCGNEREAAAQVFSDNGLSFDEAAYKAARFAANNEWRACQKAAGVPEKYLIG